MELTDGDPSLIDNPVRNLAATVLKQAAKDKFQGTDDTMIRFWCDVVEVDYDAFVERAKRNGGVTWRS